MQSLPFLHETPPNKLRKNSEIRRYILIYFSCSLMLSCLRYVSVLPFQKVLLTEVDLFLLLQLSTLTYPLGTQFSLLY